MDHYGMLCSAREQLWLNNDMPKAEEAIKASGFGINDIEAAEARLIRFAPLIAALFPETREAGGIIESPLTEIPRMRDALADGEGRRIEGALYVKRDSELAIAGSVKARGGIYEVLKHTEDILAREGRLGLIDLPENADEAEISSRIDAIRGLLSGYKIQVGSTGNLGLSIGIMSAALGYRAVVHMSCDAKAWKKALLREKGVAVIEYEGDYSAAVARGRELSLADPVSYFVDDENSVDLFMGYAVAALRLKRELSTRGIAVDGTHPLNVCLPCGVGGAPGGICFGLKAVFGNAVRAYFVEPTEAPCMLAAFLCHRPVSVTELGLSGQTAADGLAVGKASALVYNAVNKLTDGEFTVLDERLPYYQKLLYSTENIFIEPSSAIAFDAARYIGHGIPDSPLTTHVMWATGGRLVPEEERAKQLRCIKVAAALIWRGGRFMICQRPINKARGGLWEFVGGKLEPGETGEQALVRECREELGVVVEPKGVFMRLMHSYPDITVELTVYNARMAGEPQLLEHTAIEWITPEEADAYEFCPADNDILKRITQDCMVSSKLLRLSDEQYGRFSAKLVPTASRDTIIGVRLPELRKLAKQIKNTDMAADFLNSLPHGFYEENLLHALLINEEKDYCNAVRLLDDFLPFVDNWAVCDTLRPKAFNKHRAELWNKIPDYLASDHPYAVRFGLEMLMTHFLDEAFTPEAPALALKAANEHAGEDYYIDMMAAWYFATALAKRYEETLPYISERRLPAKVQGMTIRKACESFRVTDEHKAELRSLK